ncbi:hypothetical protein SARC_04749 [Sphaeroforma arctica JP610]|uniref:Uncharacterized protein n=1 Tax=Sphaeroforma arctica JP610 TaxID=667725 RepID=A0A0L0G1L1_9EUKA|nr:hypothetical protein SARC_04749 [Sphaeroforma arctica JP610]KNC82980.1 hypothetical protein SARC_04749 [Sphaeroforma arctica JP610]|eukprot:XP_014156882.1 hypothetical protein SARC_04749 [Sphaeroforma arctica JP610]
MPKLVGKTVRVVEGGGLCIDELIGNVASKSDRVSVAMVTAAAGTSEPWLTLHSDEWINVASGKLMLEVEGKADMYVAQGETVLIETGTRFKKFFVEDTVYIPVCVPAFTPERCIRENTTNEYRAISTGLQVHHKKEEPASSQDSIETKPEVIYHMTTKAEWEEVKKSGKAYYPATYEKDGYFTHGTGVPSRLITTANNFYQDVAGDWLCLKFTRTALYNAGIHVKDEEAMPVGDKQAENQGAKWIFPHIIGGIPPHVVTKEYKMVRDGRKYVSIEGLA